MYRLVGRLESSELSELYRAERPTGAQVVVKLFHPKTSDVAYAKVIADYASRLQSVNTAGIARVLEVGFLQRRLAIVREDRGKYTLGQALNRLNTREVVLPPAVALAFVIELADTLDAAHRAEVVHGALTPGNVLLGADGRSALADFGALEALMASDGLRRAFGARGRSSYRAPELKAAGAGTPASDVYALGALAYELLTLKEPSVGRDSLSTRQGEKLPPPSRLVRRLHSRIDPIIMRALEPSATRRHRSAAELADGLREFLSAQGGIPGRDDVKKFVEELFPRDVVLNQLGPVPFDGQFELEPIAGVSGLVAAELPEVGVRPSFSGGVIDDRTSTSDGLPVFAITGEPSAHETQPLSKADANDPSLQETMKSPPPPLDPPKRITWDAPVGPIPDGPKPGEAVDEVSKRLKAIEDFAPHDTQPTTAKEKERQGPTPQKNSDRQRLKTILTFAVPFKRDTDYVPPDWRKEREDRKRAGRMAVRGGAAILTIFTIGIVGFWLLRTSDAIGDLISWMPRPIEEQLQKLRKPKVVGAPPPGLVLPTVKLPDFDRQNGKPPPKPDPDPPPKRVEAPKPPKPPPAANCYAPPSGTTGFLTVSLARSGRVEIDGVRVCSAVTKLPVSPGPHQVKVVDAKTKQEWKSTMRFEAGKQAKIDPSFR